MVAANAGLATLGSRLLAACECGNPDREQALDLPTEPKMDPLTISCASVTESTGQQWIAVKFMRQPDGVIAIEYFDLFHENVNYTDLFTALRAYFAHVVVTHSPLGVPAHGQFGVPPDLA